MRGRSIGERGIVVSRRGHSGSVPDSAATAHKDIMEQCERHKTMTFTPRIARTMQRK
jgi:hypothetical protein